MEKNFSDYFELLNLTPIVIKRIENILQFYNSFCPEKIENILITDFINEDSSREFGSLWLFSKNFWMEANHFLLKDEFDITPLIRVTRISITKEEFDSEKPTTKSKVYVYISIEDDIHGEIKATGYNCIKVFEIIEKYIKPRLKI